MFPRREFYESHEAVHSICGYLQCPLWRKFKPGRIVGTVTDPNKAVVPNARVVITNTGTNQTQTLTTNDAGDFVLTPANPAMYGSR